ncbi:uncharacterized protein UV8b_07501 [Ustilaginoidea virens]|uniref:Uncharacterized protein n=1 Tax=Ustilaginoidea virens TaxID=1159556 RepID=A0A8E5HX65_USTVR|nr:uncharacterized protein UV8b_07501 [Ustilaginoidea virens]QUC23260.1 hypothetical protein UV8b_07501 [Ustilaginoidea virens]
MAWSRQARLAPQTKASFVTALAAAGASCVSAILGGTPVPAGKYPCLVSLPRGSKCPLPRGRLLRRPAACTTRTQPDSLVVIVDPSGRMRVGNGHQRPRTLPWVGYSWPGSYVHRSREHEAILEFAVPVFSPRVCRKRVRPVLAEVGADNFCGEGRAAGSAGHGDGQRHWRALRGQRRRGGHRLLQRRQGGPDCHPGVATSMFEQMRFVANSYERNEVPYPYPYPYPEDEVAPGRARRRGARRERGEACD